MNDATKCPNCGALVSVAESHACMVLSTPRRRRAGLMAGRGWLMVPLLIAFGMFVVAAFTFLSLDLGTVPSGAVDACAWFAGSAAVALSIVVRLLLDERRGR